MSLTLAKQAAEAGIELPTDLDSFLKIAKDPLIKYSSMTLEMKEVGWNGIRVFGIPLLGNVWVAKGSEGLIFSR